ncbi:hypothetical protein BpHYR1_041590 [Brachionus plicatilis]|uniref:Uncharacterized protein n=1 Tax=Brachionus plicatilis TaxID=10195 RepID=A0A3M7SRM2_BRAPC|nr:hypothetical protein BpHYR1_041590 [Brachionus plicatilis]
MKISINKKADIFTLHDIFTKSPTVILSNIFKHGKEFSQENLYIVIYVYVVEQQVTNENMIISNKVRTILLFYYLKLNRNYIRKIGVQRDFI